MGWRDFLILAMCGAWLLALLSITGAAPSAAWVQAVGSVGAIIVAIWVSHSDAVRTRSDRTQLRSDEVASWEDAMYQAEKLVNNAHSFIRSHAARMENADPAEVLALLSTADLTLRTYLNGTPPNARLAFCLARAVSNIEDAIICARATVEMGGEPLLLPGQRHLLDAAVRHASISLSALVTQYEQGVI